MSYRCIVCGKGPVAGKSLSHSHRSSNRWFRPNLQRLKIRWNNRVQHSYVCTRCIRSNKVKKVV